MYWEKAAKGFLPDIPNPRDGKLKTTPEYQCLTQRKARFSWVRCQVPSWIAITDFSTGPSSLPVTPFVPFHKTLLLSHLDSLHHLNPSHGCPSPHGHLCLCELGWHHRQLVLERFWKKKKRVRVGVLQSNRFGNCSIHYLPLPLCELPNWQRHVQDSDVLWSRDLNYGQETKIRWPCSL